jgi:hypothetical protein
MTIAQLLADSSRRGLTHLREDVRKAAEREAVNAQRLAAKKALRHEQSMTLKSGVRIIGR